MDELDLQIFDELLKKRPEIKLDLLKKDLGNYYLPYLKKLIELKEKKNNNNAVLVGVSAIQGTGKTTQGEILEVLLHNLGHKSISLSIDDHYITHKQLCELRELDPRFIRRGVTHDIELAILNLENLRGMAHDKPVLISGYYKGAHSGDGDRFRWINLIAGLEIKARVVEEELMVNKSLQKVKALQLVSASFNNTPLSLPANMGSDIPVLEHFLPDSLRTFLENLDGYEVTIALKDDQTAILKTLSEVEVPIKDLPNGWRLVDIKPDFIFYDGWMLGARPVDDELVFNAPLPALETEESKEFARFVNKKLTSYLPLWAMFDYLTCLYVPDYKMSLEWRDQAEESLRAKGEGMTHEQIQEFVYYFWRSVHPGIHIKALAEDVIHTSQVVVINNDHTVKEVLSPEEVKQNYA